MGTTNQHRDPQKEIDILRSKLAFFEKEKKELEEKYMLLAANSNEVVFTIDRKQQINFVSPSVKFILGYSTRDFLALNLSDFITNPSFELLQKGIKKILRSGQIGKLKEMVMAYEVEILKKSGVKMWTEININPLIDVDGKITGVRAAARNISDKKKIEGELKVTHSTLQSIFDGFEAIVFVSDLLSNEIIFTNAYTKIVFKDLFEENKMEGYTSKLKVPEHFVPKKKLVSGNGKPIGQYVWEINNPVNNTWYEAHDQVINWIDGKRVRFQIAYDITGRKRDEKRLFRYLKQQELFSRVSYIFNTPDDFDKKMNEVMALLGEQTSVSRACFFEIKNAGKTAVNTFEWCNDGITPKMNKFQHIPLSLVPSWKKIVNRDGFIRAKNLRKELPQDLVDIFEPYGVKAMLVVPVKMGSELVGFIELDECVKTRKWHILEVGIVKTIANILSNAFERKKIEETVLESETKLREVNATKDKFFSIVAHDLRIPIHNLIRLADILKKNVDNWDTNTTREFADHIRESSSTGFNLLENLLEWSKSQTGQISWQPKPTDLGELIEANIESNQATINEWDINIQYGSKADLMVYADESMANTVIRNLLANALELSKNGGCVKVASKSTDDFVEISIEDSGKAIEESLLNDLFHVEFDHASLGIGAEKGIGLGLIICRELIERNGGTIWAESEQGKGNAFKFILPKNQVYE